jgi:hypothetical protein
MNKKICIITGANPGSAKPQRYQDPRTVLTAAVKIISRQEIRKSAAKWLLSNYVYAQRSEDGYHPH